MYKDTTSELVALAERKYFFLKQNPLGFAISTMMAGAYVGIGNVIGGAGFIGVAYYLTGWNMFRREK